VRVSTNQHGPKGLKSVAAGTPSVMKPDARGRPERAIAQWFCPFRANSPVEPLVTKGVALGYYVGALRAEDLRGVAAVVLCVVRKQTDRSFGRQEKECCECLEVVSKLVGCPGARE